MKTTGRFRNCLRNLRSLSACSISFMNMKKAMTDQTLRRKFKEIKGYPPKSIERTYR